MLSEEEKTRLRSEEIFREEVRKSLAPKERSEQKLLAFLNSSFGIWLLSSVVLATFTAAWSYGSTERQRHKVREERISKIQTELSYRIGEASERLRLFESDEDRFYIGYALSPLTSALSMSSKAGSAIYPEFNERSARSLLVEWDALASTQDKRKVAVLQNIVRDLEALNRSGEPLKRHDKLRVSQQVKNSLKHAQQVNED